MASPVYRFPRHWRAYRPQGVRVQNRARTSLSVATSGARPLNKGIKVTPITSCPRPATTSWSPSDRWRATCQSTRVHTQQLWHIFQCFEWAVVTANDSSKRFGNRGSEKDWDQESWCLQISPFHFVLNWSGKIHRVKLPISYTECLN